MLGLTKQLFDAAPQRLTGWRLYANGEVLDYNLPELACVVIPHQTFDAVMFDAARDEVYQYTPGHMAVATRVYYRGVQDVQPHLEFHYDLNQFPDYFWIFPVSHDTVNVGYIRFLSNDGPASVRARHEALERSPLLARRFAGAKARKGAVLE